MKKLSRRRIFTFIYGFARPHLFLLIFGTVLYASQTAMFPVMLSVLTGGVTGAMLSGEYIKLFWVFLTTLCVLTAAVAMVFPGILMYVTGELKTTRRMQTKIFRTFINAGAEGRAHSGERLASLNVDTANASQLYGDSIAMFLMCVIPVVTLSAALFALEWRIGLFTVFAGLLALAGQTLFAKPLAKIAAKELETTSKATRIISDIFAGGVIARIFSFQKNLLGLFKTENDTLRRLNYRNANVSGAQALFTGFTGLLALGGVYIAGSLLIAENIMTLTALMTAVPLCSAVAERIGSIGSVWAGLQAPLEAGRRIYDLLDGDNKIKLLPEEGDAVFDTQKFENGTLSVENLSFTFKDMDFPVLKNAAFSIEENKLAAFVGPSGGGKSTLLKIIAGLYVREDIKIRIGNKTLTAENLPEWRGYFAYVDQNCTLFNLSIAENIALGKNGAASFEEIKAAAMEAGADGFISQLPQGYDTPAGEAGSSLSGGQKQRIAIARALIRKSPVLVFDEATSALDPDSEREITAAINRLRKKHTLLMATHNLASVQPDIVFKVEDGNLAIFQ